MKRDNCRASRNSKLREGAVLQACSLELGNCLQSDNSGPGRTGSLEQSTGGKWKSTFWKDTSLGDYWEPHQLYKREQLLGLDTLTSQIMGRKQVENHLTAVLRARQIQGLIRGPDGRSSSVFLHRNRLGKAQYGAVMWGLEGVKVSVPGNLVRSPEETMHWDWTMCSVIMLLCSLCKSASLASCWLPPIVW